MLTATFIRDEASEHPNEIARIVIERGVPCKEVQILGRAAVYLIVVAEDTNTYSACKDEERAYASNLDERERMLEEAQRLLDERAEKLKDLRRHRAHSQASHWPLLELGVEVALADQLVRVEAEKGKGKR